MKKKKKQWDRSTDRTCVGVCQQRICIPSTAPYLSISHSSVTLCHPFTSSPLSFILSLSLSIAARANPCTYSPTLIQTPLITGSVKSDSIHLSPFPPFPHCVPVIFALLSLTSPFICSICPHHSSSLCPSNRLFFYGSLSVAGILNYSFTEENASLFSLSMVCVHAGAAGLVKVDGKVLTSPTFS